MIRSGLNNEEKDDAENVMWILDVGNVILDEETSLVNKKKSRDVNKYAC